MPDAGGKVLGRPGHHRHVEDRLVVVLLKVTQDENVLVLVNLEKSLQFTVRKVRI